MTPPAPDPGVVHAKLDAIEVSLATLQSLGEVDATRLEQEPVTAAAVERLLCRVVDLAVDVNAHLVVAALGRAPGDYPASFRMASEAGVLPAALAGELAPSVGLRNVIVHEYARLDLDVVARGVTQAVEGYRRYVTAVAQHLQQHL